MDFSTGDVKIPNEWTNKQTSTDLKSYQRARPKTLFAEQMHAEFLGNNWVCSIQTLIQVFERRKEKSSGKLLMFTRVTVGIWSLCFLSWSGSFGKSLELSKKNRAVRVVCVIIVLLVDLWMTHFLLFKEKAWQQNFHRPFNRAGSSRRWMNFSTLLNQESLTEFKLPLGQCVKSLFSQWRIW